MNKVVLVGRLTADPELSTTSSGIEYCRFTIAIDRKGSKPEDKITDFIPCKAWRQTAIFISKYFNKGKMIAAEGEINIDKYMDDDGNNKTYTYVTVKNVEFCGGKNESAPSSATATAPNVNVNAEDDTEFKEIPEEDLPF